MSQITITLFIKSEKVSMFSADIESLGHACASPMRTGAHDRMGSELGMLPQHHRILLDAATRACEKMDWIFEIEDISKYGFTKRIRANQKVPRLQCNGKILTGMPTSDEIIAFFAEKTVALP